MADEQRHTSDPCVTHDNENAAGGEITDRGLFDFLGKKEEEKPQDKAVAAELEKVHISEVHEKKEEEEEKKEEKPSLVEKLHRSHSSSSSSSSSGEEEEGEGGEKKKKKKASKEKIKEKISGEKEEDTTVPVVKCEDVQHEDTAEKIKEKLPGGHPKKADDVATTHVVPECAEEPHVQEGEAAKEKKGLLEKIKEKLPGYHKNGEEKKEETPSH